MGRVFEAVGRMGVGEGFEGGGEHGVVASVAMGVKLIGHRFQA
jgi:hypothetical protein